MAQQGSTREKNEKERLAQQIQDRKDDEELRPVLEDWNVWYGKRDRWIHVSSCFYQDILIYWRVKLWYVLVFSVEISTQSFCWVLLMIVWSVVVLLIRYPLGWSVCEAASWSTYTGKIFSLVIRDERYLFFSFINLQGLCQEVQIIHEHRSFQTPKKTSHGRFTPMLTASATSQPDFFAGILAIYPHTWCNKPVARTHGGSVHPDWHAPLTEPVDATCQRLISSNSIHPHGVWQCTPWTDFSVMASSSLPPRMRRRAAHAHIIDSHSVEGQIYIENPIPPDHL